NRPNNPGEYPYLNIDATIVYALGGKSDLTAEDLKVDSPYNTYTNKGLPPGPIASPSQNSIGAALDPNDTDYHYYAFDPSTAEHHFSKTYKEHLAFLETLEDNA
ncbi:MAG: endolytic transglycosylase MltG, partial [Oscillospiraceae bacterium]|nr:endolytic transglycosylase MltG [Oscillospiraceae bacterium]